MTKKNWILIAVLLALAGIYVVYFTDWFKPKIIQISYTSRPERPHLRRRAGRMASHSDTDPVMFGLDHAYKLTEIKVVPLAEWQTNHDAVPIWHLVSNSHPDPVKIFGYGWRMRGMKPAVAGAHPQPLQPNVTYRLFVAAGSVKGQHDFEAKAAN
jgi:hypothetical protein